MGLQVTARVITDWYGWSRTKSWRVLKAMERLGVSPTTGKRLCWRKGRVLYTNRAGLEEFLRMTAPPDAVDPRILRTLHAHAQELTELRGLLEGNLRRIDATLRDHARLFRVRRQP